MKFVLKSNHLLHRIYGVDFSGAKDACNFIMCFPIRYKDSSDFRSKMRHAFSPCRTPLKENNGYWKSALLQRLKKYTFTYHKGRTEAYRSARKLTLKNPTGDALDSVIAPYKTFKAICNPAVISCGAYRACLLEGYVFC